MNQQLSCKHMFKAEEYINQKIEELKPLRGRALVAVSGGVDSTVSLSLINQAGINSISLLINTGFMRKDEEKKILHSLRKNEFKINYIDKSKDFYSRLKNKKDFNEKREAFRNLYFNILLEYAEKKNASYLVQGTQRHTLAANRTANNCPSSLFLKSKIKLIEPVKGLKKGEIREIAESLRLPREIAERTPFPGPGLLLRFGGEYTPQKLFIIKEATKIVDDCLIKHGGKIGDYFQIFPFLVDSSKVPYVVSANKNGKGHIMVIRAIKCLRQDRTIKYLPLDFGCKLKLSLVNDLMKIKNVARVCFDFTPKIEFDNQFKRGGTIEYV